MQPEFSFLYSSTHFYIDLLARRKSLIRVARFSAAVTLRQISYVNDFCQWHFRSIVKRYRLQIRILVSHNTAAHIFSKPIIFQHIHRSYTDQYCFGGKFRLRCKNHGGKGGKKWFLEWGNLFRSYPSNVRCSINCQLFQWIY